MGNIGLQKVRSSKGVGRLVPVFLAILTVLFSARAESAVFYNYWIAFEQSTVTSSGTRPGNVLNYDLMLQVNYTADAGASGIWTPALLYRDLGKQFTYLTYFPTSALPGGKVLEESEHYLQGYIYCFDFTSTEGVTLGTPTLCRRIGPSPYEADRQKTFVFHPVPYEMKGYVRD